MRIKVEFETNITDASSDDIVEWLLFSLKANGRMSNTNKLSDIELEAIFSTVWWEGA